MKRQSTKKLLNVWSLHTTKENQNYFLKMDLLIQVFFQFSPELDNYVFASIDLVRDILNKIIFAHLLK